MDDKKESNTEQKKYQVDVQFQSLVTIYVRACSEEDARRKGFANVMEGLPKFHNTEHVMVKAVEVDEINSKWCERRSFRRTNDALSTWGALPHVMVKEIEVDDE